MARNLMAYPELRHPFEPTPLHPEGARTVLYQGRTIRLDAVGPGDGLLVSPADLTRINGFELKPEGACFESLCIPLNDAVLTKQAGTAWIDLEAFANLLEQPYVADRETGAWSFGEIPQKRARTVPVWQRVYEQIDDPNFVLISAAQDTGGEAAAGPIFDAAGATYVQVIDQDHVISQVTRA